MCKGGKACKKTDLTHLHEACTRALRADYCGDGTSFTADGTTISVADVFGIRIGTAGWPFEAEWTASGARCAARLRIPSLGQPACWSALQQPGCGASSHFQSGTLLMTQGSAP
jgi:hypothetical protein